VWKVEIIVSQYVVKSFKFGTLKERSATGVTNLFLAGAFRKLECDDSLCRIPICCHWT